MGYVLNFPLKWKPHKPVIVGILKYHHHIIIIIIIIIIIVIIIIITISITLQ